MSAPQETSLSATRLVIDHQEVLGALNQTFYAPPNDGTPTQTVYIGSQTISGNGQLTQVFGVIAPRPKRARRTKKSRKSKLA